MASQIAYLVNFTVRIDRASHVEISQFAEGVNVANVDFGIFGDVPNLIHSWMELEGTDAFHAMAPAVEAYLVAEFAKRQH